MEKIRNASMSNPATLVPNFQDFGISCTKYSPIPELSLTQLSQTEKIENEQRLQKIRNSIATQNKNKNNDNNSKSSSIISENLIQKHQIIAEQNVHNAEKLLKKFSNKISTSVNHNNNQNNGISSNKQRLDLINPRRKISSEVHQLASYRSKNNNFNAISHFNPNCSNNIGVGYFG